MTREQAYEKLELPVGTDLQVVRQKFQQMHNDFQVQIDGSFSTEMRQRKEQQLEELKEAFALLNESTGVDDSVSLPHTEKTFDHKDNDLEEPLHAKLTIKAPEEREEKTPPRTWIYVLVGLLISAIGYFLFSPTADTEPVIADHPADTAEVVVLPGLIDKHLDEVVSILRNHSLLIGDTTYIDDVAKDLVLEARLDGQPIRSGSMVPKQSEIDLVLGNGKGFDEIAVPDLIGLRYEEAKFGISGLGLTLGNTNYNGNPQHSTDAKVIGQSPKAGQSVSLGTKINVTLAAANNKPKNVKPLQVAPVEETANELNKLASEISFEYDSSILTRRSYNALDEICRYMRSEGGRYDLIIHLHEGETEAYNRRLAQDKGDALKQYLINNGVSSGMLTVIAKGNSVQKWRGDKPRFRLEITRNND